MAMEKQLQKALNLAKKTGDRLMVFDAGQPEDTYIVMPLDDYEKLIIGHSEVRNLTEDELLDKINRDIAIWKSEQNWQGNQVNLSKNEEDFILSDEEDFILSDNKPGIKPDMENYSIGNILSNKQKEERKGERSHWAIPIERKKGAEEIIEEDRQYLENINF